MRVLEKRGRGVGLVCLLILANMSERVTAIVRAGQSVERRSKSSGEELRLSFASDGKTVSLASATPTSTFKFDAVFAASEDDRAVYRSGVKKIVESTLLGYNGTLISLEVGKGESGGGEGLSDTVGRAAEQIFACLRKSRSSRSAANLVVNCCFVAIAGERAYDLLEDYLGPGAGEGEISAPEFAALSFDSERRLQSSVHEAISSSQVLGLLRHGRRREHTLVERLGRGTSEARYHHTILSLTVEYSHFGSMNAPVSGTLSFVRLSSALPLAQRRTSTAGGTDERVLSLLSLAKVVEFLQPSDSGAPSGPADDKIYSKSLLTRLLRDAVGGNCKTVFLCKLCLPLMVSQRDEVSAALHLVSRARQVCNQPNKRDLAERALMSAYMKQLRRQYQNTSNSGEEEEEESTKEDERRREMEQAASALAQAVETGGGERDSDGEEEERDQAQAEKILVMAPQHQKKKKKKTLERGSDGGDAGASAVTIDALVGVLQDPDRGVTRALEARLKDVKIRRDVGALFSGAGIVGWMLENVEGVESESDAVTLGQLLLDRGAIFHSEGSMVFANADSLFYYAREARLGKRLLSPEEIQALLNHARVSDHTHITSVSIRQGEAERDGASEVEGGMEDTRSLGFSSPSVGGERASLQMSGGFEYAQEREQWSPDHTATEEFATEPLVDHSGACGGEGEVPTGSHTSVESWMAAEEIGGEGEEEGEGEGEGETVEDGNPSVTLQQSIPSIHTLESSQDYPHPLHMAVAIGKSPGVIRNLVMMFGVDQTDDHGRTPLMFAALGNKRASCSTLVECGAVCDKQDNSGLTALHVACYHGAKEATRVLLAKKASVATADKMGHTALHWSIAPESTACLQLLLHYMWPEGLKQRDSSGLTAMHWAIFYNRPQHLKLLLKKCAGEVEVDSAGRTLLTYAIEREPPTPQCITVLVEMCPRLLTQRDSNNRLPLHLASIAVSPVPLSLLLAHRPPRSGPPEVNCVDSLLRTPLHYSAAANHLRNAQVLLEAGADRGVVDGEGRTALDYASLLEGGEAMVSLLQTPPTNPPASSETRPLTAASGISRGSLHSPSTHSLPPLSGSAPVIQHSDDPSKVCTIF